MPELQKLNKYKAPRDKVVCVLNCCKVLYSLLKRQGGEKGADVFLPILIYVVIKANPPQLYLNCQYIERFRGADRLRAEASYYFTHLQGAIAFIEQMDHNTLSITEEELDINLNLTMQELEEEEARNPPPTSPITSSTGVILPSSSKKRHTKSRHSAGNFAESMEIPVRKHSISQHSIISVASSQLLDVEEGNFASLEDGDDDHH